MSTRSSRPGTRTEVARARPLPAPSTSVGRRAPRGSPRPYATTRWMGEARASLLRRPAPRRRESCEARLHRSGDPCGRRAHHRDSEARAAATKPVSPGGPGLARADEDGRRKARLPRPAPRSALCELSQRSPQVPSRHRSRPRPRSREGHVRCASRRDYSQRPRSRHCLARVTVDPRAHRPGTRSAHSWPFLFMSISSGVFARRNRQSWTTLQWSDDGES